MQLFCGKEKGAISVFLTFILVPVLIFCGIIVDASRLYASKTVISGAGELTMNAALSQYDKTLKDCYGLMAMASKPDSPEMTDQLLQYFRESCNARYLKDEKNDNLHSMIQLEPMADEFWAKGVENSSLADVRVLKQQIIEYMKFRGPVYMVDEILLKFQKMPFKNMKKKQQYVKKKTEHGKAISKLGKYLEKAKEEIDTHSSIADQVVNEDAESFANRLQLFKTQSVFWLAAQSLDNYITGQTNAPVNAEWSLDSEDIRRALTNPYAWNASDLDFYESFYKYENMIVLITYARPGREIDTSGLSDEEINEFNRLEEVMNQNIEMMSEIYDGYAEKYIAGIKEYEDSANDIISSGRKAINALDDVLKVYKSKVLKAENAYEKVKQELEDVGEECPAEAEEEKYKINEEEISELKEYITTNIQAAGILKDNLKALKNLPQRLESTDVDSEEGRWLSEYGKTPYDALEYYWDVNGVANGIEASFDVTFTNPRSSTFYQKVLAAMEKEEDEAKKEEQEGVKREADSSQDSYKQILETSQNEKNLYDYETLNYPEDFPSELMNAASGQSGSNMGKIDVSDHETIIDGSNEKMDWIASLVDGIDRFAGTALEKAYLMEYMTEMFNCLTTEAEAKVKKDDDVKKTLSDKELTNHYICNGEIEYILYGNPSTAINKLIATTKLFALRLAVNSIYVFFDKSINAQADAIALGMSAGQTWLYPIIKYGYLLCRSIINTGQDMSELVMGKENLVWPGDKNNNPIKMSYKEYLKLFMLVDMLNDSNERDFIARTADCIQLNTGKLLKNNYTMISLEAKVKSTVTFLPEVPSFLEDDFRQSDRKKTITYQSILAY